MKFETDVQCPHCAGTGLYSGMAEIKEAAVVCNRCDGAGHHMLSVTYDLFTGLKEPKSKIKRVYETNPGIGIGPGVLDGVKLTLEDFGGVSYEAWKVNKSFPPGSEMRKFVCPVWWQQALFRTSAYSWCIRSFGAFSSCKCFATKSHCWDLFDLEPKE